MQKQIIRTLLYFDIFKYPLKIDELIGFLPNGISKQEFHDTIEHLCEKGVIFKNGPFLLLDQDDSKVLKRFKANELAKKWEPKAYKRGLFISKFPFVKACFISGSMSKNVMHEDGDIDFFIVTQKDRLWVCRAFLVFYKRIFLLNSRKEFCINYFKSTANLKIEDENLFTAVELGSIVPVAGASIYRRLIDENKWIEDHVSGFLHKEKKDIKSVKKGLFSKFIEFCFSGKVGEYFENRILNFTQARNKKKYDNLLDKANYEQMFRSDKESAKVHPNDHQGKVLNLLAEKEKDFFAKHKMEKIYG